MTLQEAQFEHDEEMRVTRKTNDMTRAHLLNKYTSELVPDARAIFVTWFNKFATRKEEFEDADQLNEERYLSRENFVDFMRSIQKSLNSMDSSTIFAQSPSFQ